MGGAGTATANCPGVAWEPAVLSLGPPVKCHVPADLAHSHQVVDIPLWVHKRPARPRLRHAEDIPPAADLDATEPAAGVHGLHHADGATQTLDLVPHLKHLLLDIGVEGHVGAQPVGELQRRALKQPRLRRHGSSESLRSRGEGVRVEGFKDQPAPPHHVAARLPRDRRDRRVGHDLYGDREPTTPLDALSEGLVAHSDPLLPDGDAVEGAVVVLADLPHLRGASHLRKMRHPIERPREAYNSDQPLQRGRCGKGPVHELALPPVKPKRKGPPGEEH
mmetsp:Transcript_7096/g.17043  ORF Transcript_7096/g.17043 Transcript_7096/m.17043 type:complete len:277 (-) Transcript_7096:462-1292(-)